MGKNNKQVEYVSSLINNPMLNYNVYVVKKSIKILYFIITFILGGSAGLLFFSGLFKVDDKYTVFTYLSDFVVFICIGLLVSKLFYSTFVSYLKSKRDEKLRNQFRDLLDSLSASLSAGVNANEAFNSAYVDMSQQHGEDSYIAIEVAEILAGVRQNYAISEMLNDFAARCCNEDIESFANVYRIAIEKGSDLKLVIRRTHSIISDKIAVQDEIATKLASNKMQHMVMSVMPVGIVAILRFTNESFAESFASPLGIVVNILAILVFAGAFVLGQKICDVK